MRSLRARLVLGSALVAIVPLALVMILFSWEIERLVRAQAADRLQAALGGLQARIAAEGEQTSRRLGRWLAMPTGRALARSRACLGRTDPP